MFTALELQEMRVGEAEDRPDTCTIYEPPEPTAEDWGQAPDATYPDDWDVLLEDEPCLFYATQTKPTESANTGQVQNVGDFQVEIRYDAPRPSGSARVEINGLSYEVAGISDASYSIAMIIGLRRAK
jgi:hypothetical protein